MERRRLLTGMGLLVLISALSLGTGPGWAQVSEEPYTGNGAPGVDYDMPNYANSPALQKFVNQLPGLGPGNVNNLGQYIPIATPDKTIYPGSDYYEIGIKDYFKKMHSDLSADTKLRGYYQKNGGDPSSQYLGPAIIATRDRPVRIKFVNDLGSGQPHFLPVDTTVMGSGMGPDDTMYPQNRAVLHLHGGAPPWVSDGTPHQWICPETETATLNRGVDAINVPDMPDPGEGAMTYFWPNQQSGRLMFYHDHAFGITRLNVYAGEAAPYLIADPAEEAALKAGGVPGTIPNPGNLADGANDLAHLIPLVIQDKTFVHGGDGIIPATTATDPLWEWGGAGSLWFPHVYMPTENLDGSGMGMLGRWDYGPWAWPTVLPMYDLPTISHVPEAILDTPVVNGTAYPFIEVEPTAYRFRILNAANDRFFNLQLYYANNSGPNPSSTPVLDDATQLPNPAIVINDNSDVVMVPANRLSYPNMNPYKAGMGEPDSLAVPFDGRAGGVPDPRQAGPPFIQIGNECGLLPQAAVLPHTPVDYDRDTRSFTFGNMRNFTLEPEYPRLGYTLLLGPAERADVVIDFSACAGQTLILYNDGPAPAPWFDYRYDLYTGAPDMTDAGGPPSIQPGRGPNTRTIMQIRVKDTAPATPINLASLQTAVSGAFAASQPPPIVPFNTATGNPVQWGTNQLWNAANFQGFPVMMKSISEDFDPMYGRIMGRLGTEQLSFITGQETFGKWFVDEPTEIIGDGETQIWFVIHNGIDNHPIHFHMFNMQLINRVDWAGVLKPPDPNERGWKETIRMNSYDSVVLAVRPKKPLLDFGVPKAIRPLDVTVPLGAPMTVPTDDDGNPNTAPVNLPNVEYDFDWQFVWHCHILSHEELDMMRPIVMNVATELPPAPTLQSATGGSLTWTDPVTIPGDPRNEVGFLIQRSTNQNFRQNLVEFKAPANSTSATDTVQLNGNRNARYFYRVAAYNASGTGSWSNTVRR